MEIVIIVLLVVVIGATLLLYLRLQSQVRALQTLSSQLDSGLETKHRAMLVDMHSGLTQHGDRIGGHLTESGERLTANLRDTATGVTATSQAFDQLLAKHASGPPDPKAKPFEIDPYV